MMADAPKRDVNKLMEDAVEQLDDHKAWLAKKIREMNFAVELSGAQELLAQQAAQVKVRIVNVNNQRVQIVYEYPDELGKFLLSENATQELRDSLKGGHIIDPNQQAFSVRRGPDNI